MGLEISECKGLNKAEYADVEGKAVAGAGLV